MPLKDELDELEAQRVAFTGMLQNPDVSDEQKVAFQQRLDEVLVAQKILADDMAADPAGYRAWFWADGNEALIKQTRRFRQ